MPYRCVRTRTGRLIRTRSVDNRSPEEHCLVKRVRRSTFAGLANHRRNVLQEELILDRVWIAARVLHSGVNLRPLLLRAGTDAPPGIQRAKLIRRRGRIAQNLRRRVRPQDSRAPRLSKQRTRPSALVPAVVRSTWV